MTSDCAAGCAVPDESIAPTLTSGSCDPPGIPSSSQPLDNAGPKKCRKCKTKKKCKKCKSLFLAGHELQREINPQLTIDAGASDGHGSAIIKGLKHDEDEKHPSSAIINNVFGTIGAIGNTLGFHARPQAEELKVGCDIAPSSSYPFPFLSKPEPALSGNGTTMEDLAPHVEIPELSSKPDALFGGGQDAGSRIDDDSEPASLVEDVCDTPTLPSVPAPASIPPPPMWETFVLRRQKLLQQAITDSVRCGTFHDVEIYAYSKRERIDLGSARALAVIHARTAFLESSSPVLKELVQGGRTRLSEIPASKREFEYLDDSDLEDEKLEATSPLEDQTSDILDMASNVSSFDLLDNSPPIGSIRDFSSSSRHSPSLDKLQDFHTTQARGIYVSFGAAKTWQALIMYLYDGTISFSSLKTASSRSVSDTSCSPKSLYRLALQLELTELAKLCEVAILDDLDSVNIIDELFNDFTWRYPGVLSREVEVFRKHATHPSTRAALKGAFGDMALGKLPRRDVVLSALFDNMLPPTDIFVP